MYIHGVYVGGAFTHTCGVHRSTSGVIPQEVSAFVFEIASLTSLDLASSLGLAASELQGLPVCFPSAGITACPTAAGFLWVQRSGLTRQPLC